MYCQLSVCAFFVSFYVRFLQIYLIDHITLSIGTDQPEKKDGFAECGIISLFAARPSIFKSIVYNRVKVYRRQIFFKLAVHMITCINDQCNQTGH